MLVKVTVRVNVEVIDPDVALPPLRGMNGQLNSVKEAIENAVRKGQGEGFSHELENSISIMVDDVEAIWA